MDGINGLNKCVCMNVNIEYYFVSIWTFYWFVYTKPTTTKQNSFTAKVFRCSYFFFHVNKFL